MLLVDPDSRLSQLGLMPLLPIEQIRYFCSRMEMEEQGRRLPGGDQQPMAGPMAWRRTADLLSEDTAGPGERGNWPAAFMKRVKSGGRAVLLINLGVGPK